jgi:hypothetical protein
VREYISDTNALVLLTSTLEVDWAVASNAAELVAKTNATSRCVGVLTKPDRINDASRYIEAGEALDGSRNPLGHGYFVVKQPIRKLLIARSLIKKPVIWKRTSLDVNPGARAQPYLTTVVDLAH